jgi:hypothetical protein
MLQTPSIIPTESNKLISYISRKYNIDIYIDGEFIENVLPNDYTYHVYKKGKKKNSLKIFKTKKQKNRNKDNLSLYTFEKDNNLNILKKEKLDNDIIKNENKVQEKIDYKKFIQNENVNKEIEIKPKVELRYIIGKSLKYKHFENYKKLFIDVNDKYQILYKYYNILYEKHKITYDFFLSIILGLKKIYKQLNDKNFKDISEIEIEKIKLSIKKMKPSDILINRLF